MKLSVRITQMRKQSSETSFFPKIWESLGENLRLKMSIMHSLQKSQQPWETYAHISSSTDFFSFVCFCAGAYACSWLWLEAKDDTNCLHLSVNLEFIDLARVFGQGAPGISPCLHLYTGFRFHSQNWLWSQSWGSEPRSSCLSNLVYYHPHTHTTFLYSFSFNLH